MTKRKYLPTLSELIDRLSIAQLKEVFIPEHKGEYSNEIQDIELAVSDHLVGDLDKKTGHSLVGVVVSGDGVDHLDTVHQSWKSFLNGLWGTIVEWLNEFLEGLKILDVIFSLIQRFSDSKLNASPLGGGEVDLGVWFVHLLILALR